MVTPEEILRKRLYQAFDQYIGARMTRALHLRINLTVESMVQGLKGVLEQSRDQRSVGSEPGVNLLTEYESLSDEVERALLRSRKDETLH